jgi:hypothetical protein
MALDPGWLQAKPSCWSKLSQFRAGLSTEFPYDTEMISVGTLFLTPTFVGREEGEGQALGQGNGMSL